MGRFDLDRRTFLAATFAATVASPLRAPAAEPFMVWGPPAAPSIVLATAVANGAFRDVADSVTFKTWRNPDEMRAGLASGTMQVTIVPTNVAANLYNRGLGVLLLNVMTRGLLYIVAGEEISDIGKLVGKKVAVPFRNDMPDHILRRLLAEAGLKIGAVQIEYAGTPPEAIQMLVAGRVDAALLAEPSATAAILRAKVGFRRLTRAIDCQREWARIAGADRFLPQAGLAVTRQFAERVGREGLESLQSSLQAAVDVTVNHPLRTSAAAAAEMGLLSPVIAEAIPYSNLTALSASEARPDLERLFALLETDDPRIIGGKLPDAAFYAL